MNYIDTLFEFRPELVAVFTLAAFVFVTLAAVVLAVRFAYRQFIGDLRRNVNLLVKEQTEALEQDLRINLGSNDLSTDGRGSGRK